MADGTIYRVLEKLLVLNGERITYRALNVEHIGSVYETMMGFRLETAAGRSIAIRAANKRGASSTINLEELLVEAPAIRAKWIQDRTDRKLTKKVSGMVRTAGTLDDMHAAIDSVVDKNATPDLIRKGAMILQPSLERRRSGSHYTPRGLTAPIVRRAIEPILERLKAENGATPLPEQILALKVCDPAAGSGAFLVEACRQLGNALVEAWHTYGMAATQVSSMDDEFTTARRIVARRCLYGVDRNPIAVDLTKLSLWLLTISRDQPLTFLDHAIRHGDSLVGLNLREIEMFHWNVIEPRHQVGFESIQVRNSVESINRIRESIRNASEAVDDSRLREKWTKLSVIVDDVRLFGDLVIAAFFRGNRPRDRERIRSQYAEAVVSGETADLLDNIAQLRHTEPPIVPFHWEIEFPEVFVRLNSGFDAIVGNPPFAGKNTITAGNVSGYIDWLKTIHLRSHGNSDLVAHFFRRAFKLIRIGGTFGFIATNTIAQGDTRTTGLRYICNSNGSIYHAIRRLQWPGFAAVIVSTVHIMKGSSPNSVYLDGRKVNRVSAFLFHAGSNENPTILKSNRNKSFQGDTVLGMGFTFDDTDTKGVATPVSEMIRLIGISERNAQVVQPYIGGREVSSNPSQMHHRYVINFRNYPLRRQMMSATWKNADSIQRGIWLKEGVVPQDYPGPVAADWPDVLEVVERKVKPSRKSLSQSSSWNRDVARRWWQFAAYRVGLRKAIDGHKHVLVLPLVSPHLAFTFLPSQAVFSNKLYIFSLTSSAAFCILQSRVHEIWARFFGSSLKDDLSYANTDCFETFPFPNDWQDATEISAVGRTYFEFRTSIMVNNNEGLTKTYNRFHDPNECNPDILELRSLHQALDRATLDAYGWSHISTDCAFLLDYEVGDTESRKKMPYRFRWPNDVRDEVLGHLLELNGQRAAEERNL